MVTESQQELTEVVGAIHLHSDFSDGTLSIPEIARIAEEKELNFLMFSDHHTLEPKRQGLEGWYNRVLVLIGCELNDPDDRNHYLAFRIYRELDKGLSAKEYVQKVREMGGFGIIAHPAEKRNFSEAYPPYPWTDWDVKEFDGIEIWNQLSEWLEGVTKINFPWRVLHPLRSIRFPVWETLERWDRINQNRRVVGVGGIDVHGYQLKLFGFIPLEIYPYKVQLKSIRTHLLIRKPLFEGDRFLHFKDSENLIFEALSNGCCFITNFALGDGRGFRFWAEGIDGMFPMGSRLKCERVKSLCARSPLSAQMRLILNGIEADQCFGQEFTWENPQKGVYRIEAFRKKRGWIYSNPIVLE